MPPPVQWDEPNRFPIVRPLPNTLKNVFLKVVAAFEMLDSLGFMAPFPNTRSEDVV
jgi:hypothetical protein